MQMRGQKIIIFSLIATLAAIGGFAVFSVVSSEHQTEIGKGIGYLKAQAQTPWTTMALAAGGEAVIDLVHLKSVPSDQKSATAYAKYILALAAVGENPTTFGNENYLEKLKGYFQDNQFGDKNLLNDDVWVILALGSVGQENSSQVQTAKNFVLSQQNQDGGWGYALLANSDTNSTAATLMALLEAGVSSSSPEIQKGLSFLKNSQNSDGGFPYSTGGLSDSCSDAWVVSALYKLGQNPTASDWLKNTENPLDHLLTLQDEDGGFWWQAKGDNKFCSAYALLALLGKSYPVGTNFNQHHLRVEGASETICVFEAHGGTAMDIVIAGAGECGYNYKIAEYQGMGLYLSELKGETSWMYLVNNISPMVGADSYYLAKGDEVLWYSGDWLENGWFAAKAEITKTQNQAIAQAKYYDPQAGNWADLVKPVKVRVGDEQMTADSAGKLTLNLAGFENGVYPVFVERQIIDNVGYIRSAQENLMVGQAPSEHQVQLYAEIEGVKAPEKGKQESIGFILSDSVLDFGKLKPGEKAVRDLAFTNGSTAIALQSEVVGDEVFQNNLEIDEVLWTNFSAEFAPSQQKTLKIGLAVPSGFSGSLGSKQAVLTFWAMKK